ncbi:uncharacterized protein LOC119382045 [Rhipicephalus sanguineus]|uniref:uncharacterized protein LOC119382045 n=1 Tax=Rhipicephalus sanguineus TaxID=34632 RepID=UPI0020C23150|nr:uncharacterized protein LOC119382045 [Rhipicephalus sanguineus]
MCPFARLLEKSVGEKDVSKNAFWFCLSMACTVFMVTLVLVMLVMLNSGARDADKRGLETKSGADDAGFRRGGFNQILAPPTSKRPLPPGSLLCTVSEGFDMSSYVPAPDGLCAITVFDSLYTPDGSKLTPPYNEDFELFLDSARGSQKTEYAIGFDANSTMRNDTAMELLVRNMTTTNFLDYFWERNRIYHYAQVNAPLRSTTMSAATSVEYAARSLQMISSLMYYKKSPTDRPSYTIIFHTLYSDRNGELVAQRLRASPVDIFVVIAYHAEADNWYTDCRLIPPTILSSDLLDSPFSKSLYPVRLADSIYHLQHRHDLWPSTTTYAVAVGMGGRWYTPFYVDYIPDKPGNYSLGQKCRPRKPTEDDQITNIAEACTDPSLNNTFEVDTLYEALVAYNKTERLFFTYDSASNLRAKLCRTRGNMTSLKYTLAAADIQYEDASNACGYGSFPRLRMLKKLAEFFAFQYRSSSERRECMRIK